MRTRNRTAARLLLLRRRGGGVTASSNPTIDAALVIGTAADTTDAVWSDAGATETYAWEYSADGSTGWATAAGMTTLDATPTDATYGYFLRLLCTRLGVTATSAASGAAVGVEGALVLLDSSDAATLFQDDAGATPSVADADPVGRWSDKSGNNFHATKASNRPGLKLAIQNGLNVVRFDGANDSLVFSGSALDMFRDAAYGYAFIIARPGGTTQTFIGIATNSAAAARLQVGESATPGRVEVRTRRLDADTVVVITSDTTNGAAMKLYSVLAEWAAGTIKLRQNGVQVASGSYAASGNTSDTASAAAIIGANSAGANFLNGDEAYVLLIARTTPLAGSTISAIEAHLGAYWGLF